MPFAELRGQRFYYEDSGGTGPAVLLSHGFFMDHEMFAAQARVLAAEFRVVLWDERGWGQTTWTAPFSYYELAKDALSLLDHLGIDRAAFVGMSQGGFLSLRAAFIEPARVKALVLIDTNSESFGDRELAMFKAVRDRLLAGGFDEEASAMLAGLFFAPGFDAGYWIGKWRARPPEWLREPFECLFGADDVSQRLGEISCPALVVHGELDLSFPVAKAEAMCRRLPRCEAVVLVRGAGHSASIERPDIVNPALLKFLRRYA